MGNCCASTLGRTIVSRNSPEWGAPHIGRRSNQRNGGSRVLTKKTLIAAVILLLSTSGAMAQMRQGARAVLQTCKPDIAHFCSQVPPGQGRIKACMKEHVHELSEPCKE